jgi:hypothetical protein
MGLEMGLEAIGLMSMWEIIPKSGEIVGKAPHFGNLGLYGRLTGWWESKGTQIEKKRLRYNVTVTLHK